MAGYDTDRWKAGTKIGLPFDKLDAKDTCLIEGSGATRTTNAAFFGSLVDATVGHAAGKCDAAKTRAVGKYVAAVIHCYAKAAAKTGTVEAACVTRALGTDDTTAEVPPTVECQDLDGDGEGRCVLGPMDKTCTLASGHAQRSCSERSRYGALVSRVARPPRPTR